MGANCFESTIPPLNLRGYFLIGPKTSVQSISLNKEAQEELVEEIPKKAVKERVERMFFDMDDIEFGDIIKVEEYRKGKAVNDSGEIIDVAFST